MPRFHKALSLYLRRRPHERKFFAHILGYFGNRDLDNITSRRIFLYQRARTRSGAARSTVNKEVQLIARVLQVYGFKPKIKALPDDPRPYTLLTGQHWYDLHSTAQSAPDRWIHAYSVAILGAWTGLSLRQLRRVTWEWVDPFAGTVGGEPWTREMEWVLLELEKRRMYLPGKCRRTDPILHFRSHKDAWTSLLRAAGWKGITYRDIVGYNRRHENTRRPVSDDHPDTRFISRNAEDGGRIERHVRAEQHAALPADDRRQSATAAEAADAEAGGTEPH